MTHKFLAKPHKSVLSLLCSSSEGGPVRVPVCSPSPAGGHLPPAAEIGILPPCQGEGGGGVDQREGGRHCQAAEDHQEAAKKGDLGNGGY